jgi:predicted Zn-dependent protease
LLVPYEGADLSQLEDSLTAAVRLYRYEPRLSRDIRIPSEEPSEAERERMQRDAVEILRTGKSALFGGGELRRGRDLALIVVSKQDVFAAGMNFVFGLANRAEGIAVMSTFRLTRWTQGLTPIRIQERILKEAAHEIGHLLGLEHCAQEKCLMSFSNSLEQVDEKLPILCLSCARRVGSPMMSGAR